MNRALLLGCALMSAGGTNGVYVMGANGAA